MGGHIFGSGGGMAQPRHQPGMPQINPTVRAQVPHQFLAPQVRYFDGLIVLHFMGLAHSFQSLHQVTTMKRLIWQNTWLSLGWLQ